LVRIGVLCNAVLKSKLLKTFIYFGFVPFLGIGKYTRIKHVSQIIEEKKKAKTMTKIVILEPIQIITKLLL